MTTKAEIYKRAGEWLTWYNYNKPNEHTPIEAQLAFMRKCHFGAFELIARLVEANAEGGFEANVPKIILPTGVVLHEDIHA